MRSVSVVLVGLLLWAADVSAQVPVIQRGVVTGAIGSQDGTVCVPLNGAASVRMAVSGTFEAWYMVTVWSDSACSVGGGVTHLRSEFYGDVVSVSNKVEVWHVLPLVGVQSVKLEVYGTTAVGKGYTSGTILATFSTSLVPSAALPDRAHFAGREMSTRTACSYPASFCSPPAISAIGATNTLTLYNEISQNIVVAGLYVTALDAIATVRIRIIDGGDGEAVDFGMVTLDPNGPAWERRGAPLYIARGGNNLMVEVTGSPGARTKIQVVAWR